MLNNVVFVANTSIKIFIYSVGKINTKSCKLRSRGFKILLANRASAKQILLAQHEIHRPQAISVNIDPCSRCEVTLTSDL